uniref:Uncharacterized protein n=1 Tax=Parascaris equorum TaxID=6256 RepID=A0A914RKS5_PAREQ
MPNCCRIEFTSCWQRFRQQHGSSINSRRQGGKT